MNRICSLLLVCTIATNLWSDVNGSTITIQSGRQQQIKGWGVYASYQFGRQWGPEFQIVSRPNVQKALYKDLGVTILRARLEAAYYDGTSSNGLNTYLFQDLIDHVNVSKVNGISKYILSIWSPPAEFKNPQSVNGNVNGVVTQLVQSKEPQFINYIVNALKYLQARVGLPLTLSLQNEPNVSPGYDACIYNNVQYQRVLLALRSAMDANGLSAVGLLGPETGSYGDAYSSTNLFSRIFGSNFGDLALVNGVPNALAKAVKGIAIHSYDENPGATWWPNPSYFLSYRNVVNDLRAKFGYDFWMTEWSIDFDNTLSELEKAILNIQHFNREVVVIPNNYWFWWTGWSLSGDGNQQLVYGEDNSLHFTKTYRVFAKLWNLVKAGSYVHLSTTDDADLKVSADKHIDVSAFEVNSQYVVLVANPTTVSKSITVGGLTFGNTVLVFRTTNTEDMAAKSSLTLSAGKCSLTLPAKSIVILQTTTVATPPPPPTPTPPPPPPAPTPASQTIAIWNGQFRNTFVGTVATTDSTRIRNSTSSVKITSSSTDAQTFTSTVQWPSGDTNNITGWFYCNAGVSLYAQLWNSAGWRYGSWSNYGVPANVWTKVVFTNGPSGFGATGWNTNKFEIGFGSGTGTCWIDTLSLVVNSNVTGLVSSPPSPIIPLWNGQFLHHFQGTVATTNSAHTKGSSTAILITSTNAYQRFISSVSWNAGNTVNVNAWAFCDSSVSLYAQLWNAGNWRAASWANPPGIPANQWTQVTFTNANGFAASGFLTNGFEIGFSGGTGSCWIDNLTLVLNSSATADINALW